MEISDSGEDCCLLEPAMTFVLWQGSNSSTYTDVQSRRKFISLLEGFPTLSGGCAAIATTICFVCQPHLTGPWS